MIIKDVFFYIGIVSVILFIFWIISRIKLVNAYFALQLAGVKDISFVKLFFISIRKINLEEYTSIIIATKLLNIYNNIDYLSIENFLMANGNVNNLMNGLRYAKENNIEIELNDAIKLALDNSDIKSKIVSWKISNPGQNKF